MLEEFLGLNAVQERMHKDYVIVDIDSARMTGGSKLFAQYRGKRNGGEPWTIVLDAQGKELITGIGPQGNIGAPVQPHECVHFGEMLAKTKQHMSAEDLAVIARELEAFAIPHRRKISDRG